MIDMPIWVWVISILGIIATGIGLGYLIIFLFWKIERYFSLPLTVSPVNHEEEKSEELVAIAQLFENPIDNFKPAVEPSLNETEKEKKEEPMSVLPGPPSEAESRFIKFTTILRTRFNHPFSQVNTIVCWDIDLENGDEVHDSEGNMMKFSVSQSLREQKEVRRLLMDDSSQRIINVVSTKEYLNRESNINLDKVKPAQ
ncbi:MAG: hypothetical protein JXA46_07500 [Dehalococcoidales bacterium]|nr:hypothetical protein [Dehalococcoidales bacterium]